MFGNFAKLDSPRRLVQFWQNFQTSLVLLIPNCTRQRMITYTNNFYLLEVTIARKLLPLHFKFHNMITLLAHMSTNKLNAINNKANAYN